MGLFSKIINIATSLEEAPNKIDRTIETVTSLKQSIDNVAEKINEKQLEKTKKTIQKISDNFDAKFKLAYGKNYEEKIQIMNEQKSDFSYTTACKYNSIHYAGENMYVVKLYDNYGVIDTDEKVIIPIEYDFIVDYSEKKFCACKDGKWGYIDINNNVVIDFIFDDANSFSEGLASVSMIDKDKELYGYINSSNNLVIPYKYDYAEFFNSNGLACVGLTDTWGDVRKGVINKDDFTVVNCQNAILKIHNNFIEYALESHHSSKYFDLKGLPIEMDEPKDEVPKNIIIPYWNSQMTYGYYVHTDNGDFCKVEPIFEDAKPLNKDGYAIVKKDGLYGIININE